MKNNNNKKNNREEEESSDLLDKALNIAIEYLTVNYSPTRLLESTCVLGYVRVTYSIGKQSSF